MVVTPYGRGRVSLAYRSLPEGVARTQPTKVNRWRHRLKTTSSTMRARAAKNTSHSPSRAIDGVGDVGQPVRAHASDLPEDEGVGAVGDPAAHPTNYSDDDPEEQEPEGHEPARCPLSPELPRQRGRRARRAPPPARLLHGGGHGDRGPGASPVRVDRPASAGCIAVVIAAPARPPARRPPPPPAPSRWRRRRSAPGGSRSSSAATRRRARSARPGPHRSTTSVRTRGVMFSAGCRWRSSTQLDQVLLRDGGIGREEQRHVDVAGEQRLPGDRTTRRRARRTCSNVSPYTSAEAEQARRPARALRRARRSVSCACDRRTGRSRCGGRSARASLGVTTKALASCAGDGAEREQVRPSSACTSVA